MKNRKVQFLAFGTFWSLLDEFISKYERDLEKSVHIFIYPIVSINQRKIGLVRPSKYVKFRYFNHL